MLVSSLMHYVPSKVTVSIMGLVSISGFVDGTFINIIKNNKPFETRRSMDGEVARIHRKDERYTVELTLAQSSMSNNLLMAIYNLDSATGMGTFPLFIKDGSGTTTFFALEAHVASPPDASFANGMESRTWEIQCTKAAFNLGGKGEQDSLENILSFGSSLLPLLSQFGVF